MKKKVKKGTAILTIVTLLLLTFVPFASIADTGNGGNNQNNNGGDVKLDVSTTSTEVAVGDTVVFTYNVKNNNTESDYTGVTLVQGFGQNITNHSISNVTTGSAITGTVSYVVKAEDKVGQDFKFHFNTLGTLGNKNNEKSEEFIITLPEKVTTPQTGTLTVNKSYSNQATSPEVQVQLYVDNGSGFVAVGDPQTTVSLSTQFTGLDLQKSYKIAEVNGPAGFTASYPGGQLVVFSAGSATLSILNTVIDGPTGTLTVNKSYSNQATSPEVQVQLYVDNGSGFVAVGDPQTTVGLTTQFTGLDLQKSYKIAEVNGPTGFVASYPSTNGQMVVFVENSAVLTILNTPSDVVTGELTVNKTYFGQETGAEVQVQLMVKNGDVYEAVGTPQLTSGLTTKFTGLDLSKQYQIKEVNIPAGYGASYPNGQDVVFSDAKATLSILNTLKPTGTLTVNKSYEGQTTGAEVSVQLLVKNGEVYEAVGSPQLTSGLTTQFTGLDLEKSYRIQEIASPSGYTASYPDGRDVTFVEGKATLRIVNSLIVVQTGTLTVTKSYSDGQPGPQVSVQLLVKSGDVFVAAGSPQTTEGLVTQFKGLDLSKSYRIQEISVPSGYTTSYPGGVDVVFTNGIAALGITNTPAGGGGGDGGGGGGGGGGGDRDTGGGTLPTEAIPLAAPGEPAPQVVVADEPVPQSAPQTVIPEEEVPLSAPALPKTGELPGYLFYSLGSLISGLGIYMKVKMK